MTYNQLFDEYIELKRHLQSPHEILNKINRHEKHIMPLIGSLNLEDIKYKHCQQIVNNMMFDLELAPKTAKNVLAVVKTVFNYALKNEYIEKNYALFVEIPKFDNKYNIDLSTEQIKSLFDNIFNFENELYKDIFIVAMHGRRKNEVLSMQWYQIDLDLKVYHIPPQKNKSRKHDVHAMTDLQYDVFKNRYEKAKEIGMSKEIDYVFISPQTNTRLKDVRRPFQKLKKLSGVSKFRFHDFRHLLATHVLNNKKFPIEHISQALGHSSIEVTQKYITKDAQISKNVCDALINDFVGVNYAK